MHAGNYAGRKGESAIFTGLVRTIILYLLIIAGVRLMGKRQVGELEPSELVLSLIIADVASVPMQDTGIPLLAGVLPILALLALTTILSVLTVKSAAFRDLLCGRPSLIIRDGVLDRREMARTRLTIDELLEELRGKGYTDPSSIRCAIWETNGSLSVLPWADRKPPSARELGLTPEEAPLPRVVISDGRVVRDSLNALGRDEDWLLGLLRERGLDRPDQVFLLLANAAGPVYWAEQDGSPHSNV